MTKLRLISWWRPVALALVVTLVLALPGMALAAPPAQTPEPPRADGDYLEHLLQHELHVLAGQQERIRFLHTVAEDVQEWIDWLNSQGKDTGPLVTALATYNRRLNAAQAEWDEANAILTRKQGFDDAGQLVNRDLARQTLRTAGAALREVNFLLRVANHDLQQAIREYRRANGLTRTQP